MKLETPHAAALLACLILTPACYSVDDPAMPAAEGSTGESPDDDPSGPGTDPTGEDPADTTGEDPTGEDPTTADPTTGDETGGEDETGGQDETGGSDETSGDDETGAEEAPSIVEILPEDGAVGVGADTQIVIRFSQPMDQAATQAAYQSADIPAADVTFSWNDAGDELTVVPNESLAYATGTSPTTTDALTYSFTISSTGESEDGVGLDVDTTASFSTLRRLTLSYDQDDSLSGRVRDLGGSFLAVSTYNLGDNSINDPGRGYVTFDVSSVPEGPVIVEDATFHANFTTTQGNPFIDLGGVVYQHIQYDTFDDALFDVDPIGNASPLFATSTEDDVERDVTEVAAAVLDDAETYDQRVQFRFRWVFNETDNDGQTDGVTMIAALLRLDLQVLVP